MSDFSFRISFIGIIFTIVGVMVIVQMGRIQNSKAAQDLRQVIEQKYSFSIEHIEPERGEIYDRWGHLLAGNKKTYEIGISLRDVKNPKTIAENLSIVLGLDYNEVLRQIQSDLLNPKREYLRVDNFVAEDQIEKIEQISKNYSQEQKNSLGKNTKEAPSLSGLIWTPHLMRSYPEHTVASNVLGFYSFRDRETGRGFFGIEEKYDDLLSGIPRNMIYPLDPNQTDRPDVTSQRTSLILTIDREVQTSIERIIDRAVEDTGSKSGTAIIMNPQNGEILAMVTTPRMDPNEYWGYTEMFPSANFYNRAIGVTYEPGSVFKIITMAAALDTGTVTPDTLFTDEGYIVVGGILIRNWDNNPYGVQDMIGCLQHSLNVCLAWVATQITPEPFYSYLKAFGIDRRTNIDLAGEMNYPLATPDTEGWYQANLGTNAFGQGVAVTPIQLATAVSAVANGGKMMAPHVLYATISNGNQYINQPQVVNSPISEKTAYTLSEMLAVSLESEASTALVPGYRIAGKTGTASIPIPGGYADDITNASFVGWGPVDDPRFLIYIWLEEPVNSPWGSVVAAPVFSEIFQYLVVQANLPPDKLRHQMYGKATPVVSNIHSTPAQVNTEITQ